MGYWVGDTPVFEIPLPETKGAQRATDNHEKLQQRMNAFKENIQSLLRRHQEMLTSARVLQSTIEKGDTKKTKYVGNLVDDVKKHVTSLTKMVKIMERAVTEPVENSELPTLFEKIDKLAKSDQEIHEWAKVFGFDGGASAKKRRQSKKTTEG